MKIKLLASLMVATALTACGGGGGGNDTTKQALQGVLNDLEGAKGADGSIDLTVASAVPQAELGASASFTGVIALEDDPTGETATLGKMTVNLDLANGVATGGATDFNKYKSANGGTAVADVSDLRLVDSYSGSLTMTNGTILNAPNLTAVSADLDGTLVLGGTSENFVVDASMKGQVLEASDGTQVFLADVAGTIDGPDGVIIFDDENANADLDSGFIIATE